MHICPNQGVFCARLDLAVFTKIAKALNITARYVGEEPTSQVTGLYNQIMCEQLPKAGNVVHYENRCASAPEKQKTLQKRFRFCIIK